MSGLGHELPAFGWPLLARGDLGVPDPEELLAHFLNEHGGDSGFRIPSTGSGNAWVDRGLPATSAAPGVTVAASVMIDGLTAFGGVDISCEAWPTDEELAVARSRIGTPRS